jgi:uncharacterized phage protein (TIGR02220 family)
MGDQGRWWKLWASAPSDPTIQRLPPEIRWAWAAFGCYTKVHGHRGVVQVCPNNASLAGDLGVNLPDLISVIKSLPHVSLSEDVNEHGAYTVSWRNWYKYQTDPTHALRLKRARARREEKRRDSSLRPKKDSEKTPQTPQGVRGQAREILEFLNEKSGAKFRPVPTTIDPIVARLKSGASVSDCRAVIARQAREWNGNPDMAKYLRPSTLFRASKFEDYLGRVRAADEENT